MDVMLDQDEVELLSGLLRKALSELREEIYHTETTAYKTDLKMDEALLKGLLAKFSAAVPVHQG